jgi:hypothetical protein
MSSSLMDVTFAFAGTTDALAQSGLAANSPHAVFSIRTARMKPAPGPRKRGE